MMKKAVTVERVHTHTHTHTHTSDLKNNKNIKNKSNNRLY